MEHRMSVLREMRRSLLTDSSYSSVRACVALLVFVLLAINCGAPPQSQYHVPEAAMQAAERTPTAQSESGQSQSETRLPKSATVQVSEMPYLRNLFKQPPPARSRIALDDFFARTRANVQHAAVISDGSFDVLKAFIANGWAPIVKIRLPGGNPEILPLSGYNDPSSQIFFQNPTNLSERRVGYSDFEKSWTLDSRSKCVLITPQQLTQRDVERVLGKYLPQAAFEKINVRSR